MSPSQIPTLRSVYLFCHYLSVHIPMMQNKESPGTVEQMRPIEPPAHPSLRHDDSALRRIGKKLELKRYLSF
ncbi:hypothetical protein PG987_001942 [Apiospora arundinis]